MRRLIVILFFLIASVWLGVLVLKHPGFLFITYGDVTIETPLWIAATALILMLGIFYFLVTGFSSLHLWWFKFKNWLKTRREHKAYSKTQHGLTLLIEGEYKKAEQLLLAGLNQSHEPLMNYLGAAKAAHALNAFDRRDQYFAKAAIVAPSATIAIGITEAECALQQNQLELAETLLVKLQSESSKQPQVLKLLEKVYVRLGKWRALLNILPPLKKAKMLSAKETEEFEKNIYCELMRAANTQDFAQVQTLWDSFPRYVKKDPQVIIAYANQLSRFPEGAVTLAKLVQKSLRYQWIPELLPLYSQLPFDDLDEQLVMGGAWLKLYGDQPELLLFLGMICTKLQLWGRAKDYFEKTLERGDYPLASYQYGNLLEKLGEEEQALVVYKGGLKVNE